MLKKRAAFVSLSACTILGLAGAAMIHVATAHGATPVHNDAPTAPRWHPGDPDTGKPFGLDHRIPWTSSQVSGAPDPPDPYHVERVFAHLRFDHSLDLAMSPTGRWFVCEQAGVISSFPNDPTIERAEEFLDIRRKDHRYLPDSQQRAIWSMTFHPKYKENGYFYVCYRDPKPDPGRCRISRFTMDLKNQQMPPRCDAETETIMFEWPSPIDHHGGCLKFGTDGYLYCSAGDGGPIADSFDTGQDISDINASIIRIDVDHPYKTQSYSVPKDNPFVNTPGARPEVYAYGLRNVWKMSFDRKTGDLWAADVGQDLWESIYRVESGGNYGWSINEGSHPYRLDRKRGPTPIIPPIVEHGHFESRSVTGGFVYRGTKYPELAGTYVYGDWATGKIWGFRYDAETKKVSDRRELADTPLRIVGFAEDTDGELYILDYNGTIQQLVPNPLPDATHLAHEFPRLLSKTGLFASTRDLTPAPGLIPYEVNSPLWSDGAIKERYIAVPGDAKIEYSPTDGWALPPGSVVVKTFSLETEKGNRATARRLETRLLHNEHDHWRGYTYIWNDDQSDAVLLEQPQGLDRKFIIRDAAAPGGTREQNWHFPSRAECTLCHTMPATFTLGLNTLQMDRQADYDGVVDNQIRALDHAGLFSKSVSEAHHKITEAKDAKAAPAPRLADPADATQSLDARARAYLHANCSHCHMRSGGGNSGFEVNLTKTLDESNLLTAKPMHGDFGIKNAALVAPGEPERSLLLYRMSTLEHGRMPQLASSVVDENAVKLIREWIIQLRDTKR